MKFIVIIVPVILDHYILLQNFPHFSEFLPPGARDYSRGWSGGRTMNYSYLRGAKD